MKKPEVTVTVVKENAGYSAHASVGDHFIATDGATYNELKSNIMAALHLSFQEEGFTYSIEEIKFGFDLESFFDFYRVINAKALSERIGMNQSLLAQYIKGIKKPSPAQIKRILNGVQQIGRELTEVSLLG